MGVFYTVYLNKNDSVAASGNAFQCAKQLHRSIDSFYSMVSKSGKGKQRKYTVIKETV